MTGGRKHAEKMLRKRNAKAAKRAKYLALAGTSKKTKNVIRRSRKIGDRKLKHAHAMVNCGNVGCKKCFPRPVAA